MIRSFRDFFDLPNVNANEHARALLVGPNYY